MILFTEGVWKAASVVPGKCGKLGKCSPSCASKKALRWEGRSRGSAGGWRSRSGVGKGSSGSRQHRASYVGNEEERKGLSSNRRAHLPLKGQRKKGETSEGELERQEQGPREGGALAPTLRCAVLSCLLQGGWGAGAFGPCTACLPLSPPPWLFPFSDLRRDPQPWAAGSKRRTPDGQCGQMGTTRELTQ